MELKIPTPAQLRMVYEVDLAASFPPAELKPLSAIERMWGMGRYRPWCLMDSGEIAGTAFLWLGRPGWALLDYLCVPARRRNAGLGAQLIGQLRQAEPDSVILAETEVPQAAPDEALAHRRLEFYGRNDARLAGFDAEIFGVPYRLLYWWESPLPQAQLAAEYEWIYRRSFLPEKYQAYVRIPWNPDVPEARVPWDE